MSRITSSMALKQTTGGLESDPVLAAPEELAMAEEVADPADVCRVLRSRTILEPDGHLARSLDNFCVPRRDE